MLACFHYERSPTLANHRDGNRMKKSEPIEQDIECGNCRKHFEIVGEAALRYGLLLVLPRRAGDRDRRDQGSAEEAAEAHHDVHDDYVDVDDENDSDDDNDSASALAIDSAKAAGIRVGRNVFASTHACAVQPSAITPSFRVTT